MPVHTLAVLAAALIALLAGKIDGDAFLALVAGAGLVSPIPALRARLKG